MRRTVANSEGQEPNKSNKSEEGANEGAASMWQTLLDHALSGVGRPQFLLYQKAQFVCQGRTDERLRLRANRPLRVLE